MTDEVVVKQASWTVHLLRYALGLRTDVLATGVIDEDDYYPEDMDEDIIKRKLAIATYERPLLVYSVGDPKSDNYWSFFNLAGNSSAILVDSPQALLLSSLYLN